MTSVADLREKFPQYASVSDGDFLMGLHRTHYANVHPREFLNAIEGAENAHATIRNPELRKHWVASVSKPLTGENANDTGERLAGTSYGVGDVGRLDAGLRSVFQGMSAGYGDELVGNVTAALTGNSPVFETNRERARVAQGEEKYPGQSIASEIVGSLALPLGAAKSVPGAVTAGTAGGMLYASGKAEDGARLQSAAASAPASAALSLGGVAAQRAMGGLLNRTLRAANKRPTVQSLRADKNAAYRAVDDSGFKFTADQVDDVLTRIYHRLDDPNTNYVPGDTRTNAAVGQFEKSWGKDMTLSEMDRLRSRIWQRWAAAPDDQASGILVLIDEIDELIDTNAQGSALLRTAREHDKAFRRTQILDDMFTKALRQTETAGSGGNIYNNYGRVFQRILDTPRLARRFTPEQLAAFDKAIKTPVDEALARKLGKLSPDGNGLMLMLNLFGGMIDPAFLAFGGAGAASKFATDRAMMTRAEDALRMTSEAFVPSAVTTPRALPYASSVGGLSWERSR